jgi:4-amino-4-deoxy-L-arabinose transferase-like glycosyltransferase
LNRRAWSVTLLALILAVYALVGWRALLAHTDPTEMDTVAYLDAALQIHETGGVLHHLPNLIRGVYTEATQHPLYLLLLSPIARHDLQSFVAAKTVSYGIGFIFLTIFFMAARRLFGTGTAAAAGWLWLMSAGFLTLITTVACEGLLGVFVIAFWWALSAGKEQRRLWIAAGVFAALAYLTKSIGILLLPVFVVSAFWWERKNLAALLRSPWFWGFFGVFTLVSSPLFIRNIVVYGSPLYSDSSGVLWIDQWAEFSYERAAEGRFTLGHYLSSHTIGDILRTLWEGLTHRSALMIGDGLKPLPFWRALDADMLNGFYKVTVSWQGAWAAALMGLAGIGWWANRRHAAAVPTLAVCGIFWIFVGWYSKVFPGTPPTRLLYPVLILVPIYAALGVKALAVGAVRMSGRGAAWLGEPRPLIGALLLIGVYGVGIMAHSGSWIGVSARESAAVSMLVKLHLAWAQRVSGPQDRILVGDHVSSNLFYLNADARRKYATFPKLDDMNELISWIRKEKIRFMFVDIATALYNPQVFGEFYRVERPGILIPLKELPAFFKKLPADPRMPKILDFYALQMDSQ